MYGDLLDREKEILQTYSDNIETYVELGEILHTKLTEMIKKNGFFTMDVCHRIKTVGSLAEKLRRKSGKYASIYDITDLCAARIICYLNVTVDEIADALKKNFVLDKFNSIDKRKALSATQFGYLSLHNVVSLKPDEGFRPELCKIRCEIQIRTVLQHAWAEIEHDLGYKSSYGVPNTIRREFSRIAGLLEIADNQFVELNSNIQQYKKDIAEQLESGEYQALPLDEVTLNEYLTKNDEFFEFVEMYSNAAQVEYLPTPAYGHLRSLSWLGITNLGELYSALLEYSDTMLKITRYICQKSNLDFFTTNVMFNNLCQAMLIKNKYTREQISRFMSLTANGNMEKIRLDTDELFELSRKLRLVSDNKWITGIWGDV
ncbi:MAG: hypothetical protein K6C05_01640 [Anaerovibrio sp.]|uniref:GTP pyrophosphokinase n=1 Tax=Anaerovibrio sp. TaxID=1872532 RepID=UPI0025F5E517|nr:hypothetical protein [Anaerovibrio sp.]MCR5175532.1 hypothetical protein [Anaerovibrio sp.]